MRNATAIEIRMEWRAAGVPSLITADEAYRLTHGKVGTKGDHSTPMSLAYVATQYVKSNHAETMARVTGSVGATVRYEHVTSDGTVVLDHIETYPSSTNH